MKTIQPFIDDVRIISDDPLSATLLEQIKSRLGVLPNFFLLQPDKPEITVRQWKLAELSYLDNPLPSLFKERLFVYLLSLSGMRYSLARHVGFLAGLGYPAGDKHCHAQSVEDIIRLVKFKLPYGKELEPFLTLCHAHDSPLVILPDADTVNEQAVFTCAAHIFLQTPYAATCFTALSKILDANNYNNLTLLLSFIRTTQYWTELIPDLAYEEDVQALLDSNKELARYLLKEMDQGATGIAREYEVLPEQNKTLRKNEQETKDTVKIVEEIQEAILLELLHDPVIVWNLSGTIIIWNKGAELHYGYTKAEAIGQPIHDLLKTAHTSSSFAEVLQTLTNKGKWTGELRHRAKNGEQLIVESRKQFFYSAGQQFILETIHDVTDKKLAEEALRKSEEKYRTLFESIDEAFCMIEMLFDDAGRPVDYRYLDTNPAFAKQAGIKDVIGKRMLEIDPDFDVSIFEVYGNVVVTGNAVRFEYHSERSQRFFDIYAFRVGNPADKKAAVLFTDVTKRKVMEKQQEDFLGIASHELKTPVTSIKAYAEVLKEIFEETKDAYNVMLIHKLDAQVDRLTELIHSLLDTTKISEGHLSLNVGNFIFNNLMIEKVEELQRLSSRHRIVWQPAEEVWIIADRERLGQVLTNLISNAIKYSPRGGDITITCLANEAEITVGVQDNGIGITDEMQQRVFDRFYRVQRPQVQRFPGMGLGLYITAGIIHQHGGTIKVESSPGKGSTFSFTLPLINNG